MTKQAIIMVGMPASGKTTAAKAITKKGNWVNVNRDDLRFSLFGADGWVDYKFSKEKERLVTDAQEQIVSHAAMMNKNIIISDTNLNPIIRKKWIDTLNNLGYKVEVQDFEITLDEALKRDYNRPNSVGRNVIMQMWKKWLIYKGHRTYTPDTTLPPAIIFDLDGTLASMQGVRGPFEWDKVGLDNPIPNVVEIVRAMHLRNKVIILSGRDGVCKEASEEWLKKHNIPYDEFYIRTPGDTRKDTIIKAELFWDKIGWRYNVKMAIDDRPCMVRMWIDLGVPVMAVGNPFIEF